MGTLPALIKPINGILKIDRDIEMTAEVLSMYIQAYRVYMQPRFFDLKSRYNTRYPILNRARRELGRPDNRLIVNFVKYAVDTLNGYFIGNPVKVKSDNKRADEFVNLVDTYNSQDDNNSELSKQMSIYGRSYEMYYTDDSGNLCITYLPPYEAFMIYDESIIERPMYFVRLYKDVYGVTRGSISDRETVRYFRCDPTLTWEGAPEEHGFDGVPATEYEENNERQGLAEPVLSLIDSYNTVLSGKADDVDYFADAYMAVIGAKVDPKDVEQIRNKRLVNIAGSGDGKVDVKFLVKPSADDTQENLLNRLERLIFEISMVTDIASKEMGNASGQALRYKLWSINTIAKNKERKFTAGMQNRYRLLFSHPLARPYVSPDDWTTLNFIFTPNIPSNLNEEVQTAASLQGITSKETALSVLSIVDDVTKEMARIDEESEALTSLYNTEREMSNGDE